MSAMPTVDNYIIIYIFIEKPWQALDITMVGVYHIQMWKWIVMIFLCNIFSGARRMLKSLRIHQQSQRPNGKKWWIVGGQFLEKNSLSWSLNRLQLSLYNKQVGLEVNTIIEDVRGWRSCWVAMTRHPVRRLGERCLASVTRACAIPSVVAIVNTGGVVIHGKYRFSEVNKSIVISIIDRNVYRWVTGKRWFSQHDQ